jgi:hypothetical protein
MLGVVWLTIGIMRNAAQAESPKIANESAPPTGPIDAATA